MESAYQDKLTTLGRYEKEKNIGELYAYLPNTQKLPSVLVIVAIPQSVKLFENQPRQLPPLLP